jgi:2-haloacid dehalogenase
MLAGWEGEPMHPAPELVVFDVNETLSDMRPMGERWEAAAGSAHLARQWFAELLRDGFALAATGRAERFAVIAEDTARRLLAASRVAAVTHDAAVQNIMGGFGSLEVHPDVPGGVRALHAQGLRLVTLTNGGTGVADGLLTRAGLRDLFEELYSVEDVGRWKPAPEPYAYALERCGVPADRAVLVACHPWDIDGAARAGLRTAWVNRTGAPYPAFFTPPDVEVRSLTDLAGALTS